MSRSAAGLVLESEVVTFQAEVRRLALALVEQALATELARWQAAMQHTRTPAPPRRSTKR